jgi:hypothetical protein
MEGDRRVRVPGDIARVEFARRVYDRAIDWYKVAESKAQLILTVNGVFVTIAFGILSSKSEGAKSSGNAPGPETWVFLSIAIAGLAGAIGSATACLLSRHNRNIASDFARLNVDPGNSSSYCPEALWYFGHLATLEFDDAVKALRRLGTRAELQILTYNVGGLSRVVLRKHRFINAGWLLTGVALISLLAAAASYLVRLEG